MILYKNSKKLVLLQLHDVIEFDDYFKYKVRKFSGGYYLDCANSQSPHNNLFTNLKIINKLEFVKKFNCGIFSKLPILKYQELGYVLISDDLESLTNIVKELFKFNTFSKLPNN